MESFKWFFSKSSSWLMMLSRSFWCRMTDEVVFLDGFSLTSVTTSDMSVDVETAFRLYAAPFWGLRVSETVDPWGVLRGESTSSLFLASWYRWYRKTYWKRRKTLITKMIPQKRNTNKCVRLNRIIARWWSLDSKPMIDDSAITGNVTFGGSKSNEIPSHDDSNKHTILNAYQLLRHSQ